MSERLKPDATSSIDPVMAHQFYATDEDEINLLDLALVIAKNKRMILAAAFVAAMLAALISLLLPNIYRAEVVLAPVQSQDAKGGNLSAALEGLGGLASLAGISLAGGGNVEEALAVLKSPEFLWDFAQENQILPILFADEWDAAKKDWIETDPREQPGPFDLYRLLVEDGVLEVGKDDQTGLVTVALEWEDAALATQWANTLVAKLNSYLAQQAITRSENNLKYLNEELARTTVEEMRKTLFDLIAAEQKNAMLANAQKEFAFKVLSPALIPDEKIKPKRALIVVLAAFIAGFMAMIWAFIREGVNKAQDDPEQAERMRQLRQALRWRE